MSAALREVMGTFATGVTVLTTPPPDEHGMTANAVTSLSLDPPLVLACVGRDTRIHTAIARAGAFGMSILASDQSDPAQWFADSDRPSGPGQFEAIDHLIGERTGAPLIRGALGWIECRVLTTHEGGDHLIVVGDVLDAVVGGAELGALLFHRGRLGPVLDQAA
jgi:flavin reductase